MSGTAGTDFLGDMVSLIKSKWRPSDAGPLPTFRLKWDIKEVGHGAGRYDMVIITFDSESADIFSMIAESDGTEFKYDWLHDMSLTIDIMTSHSARRGLQITNEIMRIIKSSVVSRIGGREYLRILPEGVTVLNDDKRNIYRTTIGVSAMRYNP